MRHLMCSPVKRRWMSSAVGRDSMFSCLKRLLDSFIVDPTLRPTATRREQSIISVKCCCRFQSCLMVCAFKRFHQWVFCLFYLFTLILFSLISLLLLLIINY